METIHMEQQLVRTKNTNTVESNFPITSLIRYDRSLSDDASHKKIIEKIIQKNSHTPWLKYLYLHGQMLYMHVYSRSTMYSMHDGKSESTTWEITWDMPAKNQTYFLLAYGEDYRVMKKRRFS